MSIKVLRPHLSVGVVTGAIDLVVILLGWPVFGSVDAVLYGIVTTAVTSLVIDKIMYGSNAGKMLTIITTKGQEIADEISRQCERGSTMVKAVGTYTGTERQMLLCVCVRPQVYRIRMAAYRIDPGCMVMVTETGEVYGEGFRASKHIPRDGRRPLLPCIGYKAEQEQSRHQWSFWQSMGSCSRHP